MTKGGVRGWPVVKQEGGGVSGERRQGRRGEGERRSYQVKGKVQRDFLLEELRGD